MSAGQTAGEVVRDLLDRWAASLAAGRADEIGALFTEDGLVQGFDPVPAFGPAAATAYYAKQPRGLTAEYELLSARWLREDAIVAYAGVLFHRPDGDVPVYLTIVAERGERDWQLGHYHASKLIEA